MRFYINALEFGFKAFIIQDIVLYLNDIILRLDCINQSMVCDKDKRNECVPQGAWY